MAASKKSTIDSILNWLYRFKITDDTADLTRLLSYKIDQVRAELIINQYQEPGPSQGVIDPTWLSAPFIVNFHRTNFPDNQSINNDCIVSKATIPQTISLISPNGNLDLGVKSLTSMSGRTNYSYLRKTQWVYQPSDHPLSKLKYYDRYNQELLINDDASQLLFTGLLLNPEDGYLSNTQPIASGSLVSGTSYKVLYSQIIYNNAVVAAGSTFTANATATFLGNGTVYLASQVESFNELDGYPASGEMMRQIEFEILTKEFRIEKDQLTDVRNDSTDDSTKTQAI